MGFNSSSGVTSVTGNVTAVPAKSTVLVWQGVPDNATTTMGTVGAGKVWRIVGFSQNSDSRAATSSIATILLNDVVFFAARITAIATYGGGANASSVTFSYDAAPVLTVGQTVKFSNPSANGSWLACYYIEENA
jgi:hypothetical protein